MTVLNENRSGFKSNVVLSAILFFVCVCSFVPFLPLMPVEGLDPSWFIGMNQAIESKLLFGSELIFTYGPYSAISTGMYHPATDARMLWGSGFLGASFGLVLILLTHSRAVYWKIPLILAIAAGVFTWDALIFFYGVAVGVYCLSVPSNKAKKLASAGVFALLLFTLGLLPLIKGSFIIFCAVITGVIFVQAIYLRQWTIAIISVLSPAVALFVFWFLCGQSVSSLADYFTSMVPLISAYTEAMATIGDGNGIFLYVLAVFVLVIAVWKRRDIDGITKLNLSALFGAVSFLVFKAGFVRHGHEFLSGDFVFGLALIMMVVSCTKYSVCALALSFLVWLEVDSGQRTASVRALPENFVKSYKEDFEGLRLRVFNPGSLEIKYSGALEKINRHFMFSTMKGTTDIYSFNQVNLISSNAEWNPRPVFQSYAAYNKILADINKEHLLGNRAPDNIFFNVEPIDGRLPSLEDGVSWPVLLSKYQPVSYENKYLLLQKKESDNSSSMKSLGVYAHKTGEKVKVEAGGKLLFAKIKIDKTVWGRVADFIFKPSELKITVELKGGGSKSFRFISSMARSGFVVSPLIESSQEFGLLYSEVNYLADREVVGLSVDSSDSKQWKEEYELELFEVNTNNVSQVQAAFGFVAPVEGLVKFDSLESCEGSIENANGVSLGTNVFSASSVLRVDGWITPSVKDGALADKVFAVLTNGDGKNLLLPARKVRRQDVGEYLANEKLENAGYTTITDVSKFTGKYRLTLAYEYAGKLIHCSNFVIDGNLKGVR